MDNTLGADADAELTAEEAADLKTAIRQMFAEMDRVNARIESNQADIEKLKAETRAMLAQLRAAP